MQNIDDTFEIIFTANRQVQGNDIGTKMLLSFCQGFFKIGIFPVYFVHKDNPRQVIYSPFSILSVPTSTPETAHMLTRGGFYHPQRADDFANKVKVSGCQ